MTFLYRLISGSENRLLQKIAAYAGEIGYPEPMFLPEEAWRCSIADINQLLLKTLHSYHNTNGPVSDTGTDGIAVFRNQALRLYRPRGLRFEQFFSLMKYYRRSYIDLIREGASTDEAKRSRLIVERFFDHLEMGLLSEGTTSRHEIADRARESEDRFLSLAEQVGLGVFETDAEGCCTFVNGRWCEIAGCSPKKAFGRNWLLFVAPDDRERVSLEWAAAGHNREFSLEYDFSGPAGKVIRVRGTTRAKKNEAGELLGFTGTIVDITRQKNNEEEISRLKTELEQQAVESAGQMDRLAAENVQKLQEIASLYRMSNTMLSTIRLNKLIHLILTALTSAENPFFDRAMLFLINRRTNTMQGMLGVTRETSACLINPVADVEDILTSRWDMSEEDMQHQQNSEFSCQVRASRLELDTSLNIASRAVLEKRLISVDDAAREKLIDRAFSKRFGIKSCAFAPLMAKEQVVGVIIVDNALQGKKITRDDLRFLQLVTNQAGMAIENSMLYNRLEDANRSLREVRERLMQGERLATIGEMAASIAHEVKGPLVSIGGFARRLERKLAAATAEQGNAATIVREVERLEKLVSNILVFAKKATICYSTCNIIAIIEDSLEMLEPTFEESKIKVCRKYPSTGVFLLGDALQLKQVFLNLFENAHEAMTEGGELRIALTPAKLNGNKAISIKVSDTGSGVPMNALHNIFTSFFTTKETGTGLGLPIANRIIVNHGGKINLTNKKGSGAEFNVILPFSP